MKVLARITIWTLAVMLTTVGVREGMAAPDLDEAPVVSAYRELLWAGWVKDTITWTAPLSEGVVGYDTRRTTDEGKSWWTSGGYVDDPNQLTWNSNDNADGPWSNIKRGFQVRYDFGSHGMGPWSETVYIEKQPFQPQLIGLIGDDHFSLFHRDHTFVDNRIILYVQEGVDEWDPDGDSRELFDSYDDPDNRPLYLDGELPFHTITTHRECTVKRVFITRVDYRTHWETSNELSYGDLEPDEFIADCPNEKPVVTATREVLANGKVNDTMLWDAPENSEGLVGYDTRRTTNGGYSWWTSHGYVDDINQLSWSAKDDAGQEWRNIRRGFQVRYHFGGHKYGPWSEIFYINP